MYLVHPQADALREARLAAAAAKAGSKVRHAKHVSKMRRLNEERYSEMKRLVLDSKLQTAADRRREGFTVRAAVNAEVGHFDLLCTKHLDCSRLLSNIVKIC